MGAVPLRRNRDFALLQGGQLLSALGSESAAIAYPLLVLAVTGSPAMAGVVSFARVLPFALFGLLAGVAADRYDRRALMLAADAVKAVAVAALAVVIALGEVAIWQIAAVAFVQGAASAVTMPAAAGALRSVVPPGQLHAAAGVQQSRLAAALIAGPPIGGALFGVGRAVPFVADAVSYAFSVVSLLLMRTPFQHERPVERAPLRARVAEGFRFLWRQPFIRTTTFVYGLGNFIIPALLFAVVVVGERQGLTGGRIGVLLAATGVCVLAGSLASPLFRRRLSARAILLLELWAWPAAALFVAFPDVHVLVAAILPALFAAPITDSVVIGSRLAITPDRLVGRVESVRSTLALSITPFGPLAAGVLLSAVSASATVAVFALLSLGLAVWGTASAALREPPLPEEA
ncbi:MAG TPA: MFS transporter, partial [Solirubrobacteraceae bacterium]|nr:MFS transporter [Solirubrobacteraceae bacterium]